MPLSIQTLCLKAGLLGNKLIKYPMKKIYLPSFLLAILLLSGCSVIGGIFKAGAAVAIIGIIIVIALIIWIVSMFRGKNQ